ncbi:MULTISPECIES: N-acetylmuramoyl-L-alanine amidase family protein [unclassified Cellulophaga]|uniref:N-acetylmuramoyl-L-alanine amidase family protein n=1 Tax=unclassified Cellulophaga TaxID=2634405 RepID=UPI0026E3C05A|nr:MULTISPECIES: N-acetylmuramoyl-L-alanine amidase [unclassified Cellulophaga]MDO6491453.1 N-acetylmuramoyl-L-alanine amidase [Cellulophaga sp. 2_MG-2023]MDO6493330.1 N-acetylmuramoyl-L-alanine amidase [Cellulophaga sp. 3_MG-2023]
MNKTFNNYISKFNSFLPVRLLLLTFLVSSFSISFNSTTAQDKFVVVLDAGHGGHDPGNLGNGYLEKNIALNIVLKAGELLSQNPNIKVIYTRKDDTFVDLFERGEIANKANADLFVSVHCDSHTSDAHGAGTFVLGLHANKQNFEIAKKENSVIYLEDNYQAKYSEYNIDSPESVIGLTIMQEEFLDQSIALAKLMQDKFSNKLKRTDRKVKQAGFIVLHQTFMPSVLVETGFLTNKGEGAYLNSKSGQLEMGTAIAESVLGYMDQLVSNALAASSSTPEPEPEPQKEVAKVVVKKKPEVVKEKEAVVVKKPQVKEPVVVKKTEEVVSKTETTALNKNIEFRVQLFASGKSIPLKPDNFKGLNTLTKEPVNNLYRYMSGRAKTYYDAKMIKSNADIKGYTSSYIVAYKDGKRINVEDAIKYLKE